MRRRARNGPAAMRDKPERKRKPGGRKRKRVSWKRSRWMLEVEIAATRKRQRWLE